MGRVKGKKSSPALVVSIVALVFAVAGTSVAGVATISVLNKKEKKQTRNIANQQIDKRASGLNVNSAKTAAHATDADHASLANTAGNADQLDGQDATDFTGADELHTSGRVVINDPTPGDTGAERSTLVAAGAVSVEGECVDDHPTFGDLANVTLAAPSGSSLSGTKSTGQDLNLASFSAVSTALAEGTQVRSLNVTVVAPSGEAVSISASAEAGDSAGDCVFGATAIGP
jgi:uncharacterized protein (DUF2147 family)